MYQHIETEILFSNQFNTKEGFRVWFWQEITDHEVTNLTVRYGYYLEFKPDDLAYLKNLLARRVVCGYCGNQYTKEHTTDKNGICYTCAGSKYLTIDYIKRGAIRFYPIGDKGNWQPLNKTELKTYLYFYHKEQKRQRKIYLDNDIKRTKEKLRLDKLNAEIEHNGKMWLIDNGLYDYLDNVIFYNHSGLFCFGWRESLRFQEEQKLKGLLETFPYAYEIKTNGA